MMQTMPCSETPEIKPGVARSVVGPNGRRKSVSRSILVFVLTGILLTRSSLAQDSAQAQASESVSQHNSVSTEKFAARAQPDVRTTASQLTSVSDRRDRAQGTVAPQLEAGTTIHVSLVKPVGARKNKSGDEVVAKTTWDVRSEEGTVVLPVGSTIIGHITKVSVRTREQRVSTVRIVLDHAFLTDGTNLSLALAIQAIGRVQANDAGAVDDEFATGGESRAMATRAISTPASMGGNMLRDAFTRMNAAANPAEATELSEPLTSSSQGVIGLPNLYLSAEVSAPTHVSVVSSKNTNVQLNSGTEMILRVITPLGRSREHRAADHSH
jgi:hypothetical protein